MKPNPLCSLLQFPVVEGATGLNPNPTQQSFGHPRPVNRLSSRRSLGLRLHTEPTFIHEAAATPEPPQQQDESNPRVAEAHTLSSEGFRPPFVPTDRSVHSPNPAPTFTDQAFVVQPSMVQPRTVQPVSFEQTNLSLHRPACTSGANTYGFCRDDQAQLGSSENWCPPEQNNTTHQWVASNSPQMFSVLQHHNSFSIPSNLTTSEEAERGDQCCFQPITFGLYCVIPCILL